MKFEKCIGEIINLAFNRGYSISLNDCIDGSIELHLKYTGELNYAPSIAVTVCEIQKDCIYYMKTTSISFPTLHYYEGSYADHIQSIIEKWAKIGELITAINSRIIDFSKYEFEESNS